MAKMKDWMMDMESHIGDAYFDQGITDPDDVVEYVREKMNIIDERYIRQYLKENAL